VDRGGYLKKIDVLQESLRILLIEGNAQDTLLIKTVFSFFPQLEIFEVSNLSEGIKALGRRVYDLVLLDLFLPDSEGIETLDQVLGSAGQVPVAVFSELEDEDLAIMAFEKGAQDYLSKSDFNARNLYRFLFFSIQRSRHQRRLQAHKDLLERYSQELEEKNSLLEDLSRKDALTGVANRRALDEALERELKLYHRYKQPFSLIIMDLDHFKTINDRYGHPAGDMVLREIGLTLRRCLRETDVIGRYGGEEFIAIVHGDEEIGTELANKILEEVRNLVFVTEEGPFHITASFGVCVVKEDYLNIDTLLDNADKLLYEAKHGGRNQVKV
jgi:diguanylate cyclase (GGDEF)-like protein